MANGEQRLPELVFAPAAPGLRRIRLRVEYDGTNYAGFQMQLGAPSIQQELEQALAKLCAGKKGERQRVVVFGASRTDGGVHAEGQMIHFDTENRIPAEKLPFALNELLPDDIRIQAAEDMPPDFHARFAATGKLYRYCIWNARHASALHRLTHAHIPVPLDLAAMRAEAEAMLGTHDFRAFQAAGAVSQTTVRTVHRLQLARSEQRIEILVHGNAFLYNMVRILAGTLIDVGRGLVLPGAIPKALASGSRLDLGITAPAHGLTLLRVFYGDDAEADRSFTAAPK